MGIDPGYGSSSFGIVITQLVDAQLQVLYADEFQSYIEDTGEVSTQK